MLCLPENATILEEVLAAYDFPHTLIGAVRYGQGHINDTFCVICQPKCGDPITSREVISISQTVTKYLCVNGHETTVLF